MAFRPPSHTALPDTCVAQEGITLECLLGRLGRSIGELWGSLGLCSAAAAPPGVPGSGSAPLVPSTDLMGTSGIAQVKLSVSRWQQIAH